MRHFLIFLVLIIIVSFLSVTYYLIFRDDGLSGNGPAVCFGQNCFGVELASTPQDRARGLMYRTNLATDRGMLFIFDSEGIYHFWMKNTLIALDIVWFNAKKEVVFIAKDVPPCSQDPCPTIKPDKNALLVLEVNAGAADKIGLKTGDTARIIY